MKTQEQYMTHESTTYLWNKITNKLNNLKVNRITIGNTVLTEERLAALLELLDKEENNNGNND